MRRPGGWTTVAVPFLVLALVAAACGGGGGDVAAPDGSSAPAGSSSAPATDATTTTATSTTTTRPPIDAEALLAKDPLVIFNAFPPRPVGEDGNLPAGQRDWDELWKPGAPWQTALSHVDVYRLHAFQVRRYLSDAQLITLFAFLREHGIALMFETEPLEPPDPAECAQNESFEGIYDREMAQRIADLGGRIDIIAVEEPYHFGHLLDTPTACRYTVERVVDEVRNHVEGIREIFGRHIPVGSIEPIWQSPRTTPDDMAIWLDTYRERAGEPFAFLHVDPDWTRPDWADVAAGIASVADARDVPFGILYTAGEQPDGATWMQAMAENAAELEQVHGVRPQHVSIQSWFAWPDHDLPETDPTALTSGLVRYFGDRVGLTLEQGDEGLVASLSGHDGDPVAGATLSVGMTPIGRGVSTQTVEGTVPDGATEAVALVRANAEDARVGEVDATLVDLSYSENGGPNLIPNGDFARGRDGWPGHGDPPGQVTAVTGTFGSGLELEATPEQNIFLDGTAFPVTAGSPFELTATYEISEAAADTVVISVEFLGQARANVFAHLTSADVGDVITDADGRAVIPSGMLTSTPASVTVRYTGDLTHWPASASLTVGG